MNESDQKKPTLDEVFSPRGVAVVGVSGSAVMSFASSVVMSLKAAGFPNIYPVNPKYNEVLGLKCYPNLQSIAGPVDHVVVNIPAEASLALMDDCAAKGVRSVHFFTAGFSESGIEAGAVLEKALLDKARQGGFRIIGPNCVGLFVPKSRLVNGGGVPLEPGPVGLLSQSGGHAQLIPVSGALRGLKFSKIVSYGNALDVDECELLDYFAQDPETDLIGAYIEGVRDSASFRRSLSEAAARKPVVIYKGGTTEAGLRAAHGHTASMTSSAALFSALCRQAGAILADDGDELIDVLVALRFTRPLPEGMGTAIIGAGGGPSVLASDEMEKAGLIVPGLPQETRDELGSRLPVAGSIFINPIDTPNLTSPDAVLTAMEILGARPDIHILVYHLGFHPIGSWGIGRFSSPDYLKALTGALRQAMEITGKPVVLALKPGQDIRQMEEFLKVQEAMVAAGLPVFPSMSRLARAMVKVVELRRRSKRN